MATSTPTLEQVAAEHYAQQRGLVQQMVNLILQLGRMLSWDEVRSWFAGPAEALRQAMTEAQAEAAAQGAAYVGTALAAAGVASSAVAAVVPGSLAGVASDGRPLESLLALPVRRGQRLIEQGMPEAEVTPRVIAELVMIGRTQVADAGRVATGVAQVANRAVVGYVRQVELPACARCILLAGKLYRTLDGFARHPNCDCVHVPVSSLREAGDLGKANYPQALFEGMSRDEQDRIFGQASARAIRDGADLGQVVNARRGLYVSGVGNGGVSATWEGTTRRGIAGKRLGARRGQRARVPRLTPEQIYKEAGGDRDEALRLLHRFGYITDTAAPAPSRPARTRERTEPRAVLAARQEQAAPQVPAAAQPYHRTLKGIEDLARRVEELDVVGTRRLGGMNAVTELLTLSDGSKVIRKTTKRGSEDEQSQDSEQLGSLLARSLGLPAPAVYRNSPDRLYMEYVPGDTAEEAGRDRRERALAGDDGKLLGLVDLLGLVADRNDENWILRTDGRIAPIDHGSAYLGMTGDLREDRSMIGSRAVDRYYSDRETDDLLDNPLTPADVAEVRRRLEALRPDYAHLGREEWLDYSLTVLDGLGPHARGDHNLISPTAQDAAPDEADSDSAGGAGTPPPPDSPAPPPEPEEDPPTGRVLGRPADRVLRRFGEPAPRGLVAANVDFRYIEDPDARTIALLQYQYAGRAALERTAANLRSGRDPFEGIDFGAKTIEDVDPALAGLWFLRHETPLRPIHGAYDASDLRADLLAAATRLNRWLSAPRPLPDAFKGLRIRGTVEDLLQRYRPGRQETFDISSFTSAADAALRYADTPDEPARPDDGTPVLFLVTQPLGVRLESVGGLAGYDELLLSGRAEVIRAHVHDGRIEVLLRWLPSETGSN